MVWSDLGYIIGVVAGVASVIAALYAYLQNRIDVRATSRAKFVQERQYLGQNRIGLTAAALAESAAMTTPRFPGMLSRTEWLPPQLVPLDAISVELDWEEPTAHRTTERLQRATAAALPWAESSSRFPAYSTALGELARPGLFQDLPCYRLLSARLDQLPHTIHVGMTTFFRGIDESEAVAHEFARAVMPTQGRIKNGRSWRLPIRSSIGNPFACRDRNVVFSVSALTLRVENPTATFFLHSRDSKAVAIAGNLLHLAPSGVFQPTSDDRETARRDGSPWLTLCREYAEEFLGVEEAQGAAGVALSYTHDQPYAAINDAYRSGTLRIFVCGLGLDPLTLCPELVSVACFDADAFDQIFGDMVVRNSEGYIRGKEMRSGRVVGYDFTSQTVSDLLASKRLSPAAQAALSVAWRVRSALLRTSSAS
jgi:hypothetical protein